MEITTFHRIMDYCLLITKVGVRQKAVLKGNYSALLTKTFENQL